MTLRELRLWHWRRVLSFRRRAVAFDAEADAWDAANPGRRNRYRRGQARSYHKQADFHLGAVQALNDFFPVGDTAERDVERAEAIWKMTK